MALLSEPKDNGIESMAMVYVAMELSVWNPCLKYAQRKMVVPSPHLL